MQFENCELFCMTDDEQKKSADVKSDAINGSTVEQEAAVIIEQDVTLTQDRLNSSQITFIDDHEWWKAEWIGMPEFIQEDASPYKTVYVHFRTRDDLDAFIELVQQRIGMKTKSIWFPKKEWRKTSEFAYVNEQS